MSWGPMGSQTGLGEKMRVQSGIVLVREQEGCYLGS